MNKLRDVICVLFLVSFLYAPSNGSAQPDSPLPPVSKKNTAEAFVKYDQQLLDAKKQIAERSKEITSLSSRLEIIEAKITVQNSSIADLISVEESKNSLLQLASKNEREISRLVGLAEENEVALTDWIMAVISTLLLFLSILAWQVNRRIAGLTGAMESHSDIMLRLEAGKDKNVRLIWWDPTLSGPCKKEWPSKAEHGTDARVKTVYIGLPLHLRKNQDNCWCGIKRFISASWKCFMSVISIGRYGTSKKLPNKAFKNGASRQGASPV